MNIYVKDATAFYDFHNGMRLRVEVTEVLQGD